MPTTSAWKKYMPSIKDWVFIISTLIAVVGWIRSETVKATENRIKIENLTKAVDNNTKQLEEINKIMSDQKELNGKIIMYMQLDNHQ